MADPIATEAVSGTRPIALVTGASEGLGREFARLLAADGFDLTVVARNEARLIELAEELEAGFGIRVQVERADLAQLEEQLRLAEMVRNRANLKVVVNNAAFSVVDAIHKLPPRRRSNEWLPSTSPPSAHCRARLSAMRTFAAAARW